ncbi:MAG: ATP-binding cassette domain-containing protein [Marinilabiliaceae bacterium]|nr:ATP-binding cassette domain-containing protein [Marinilabiliaceae bacterium]
MENLLEIDSVQLKFGEKTILNNIYLKSETGKVTGILGRNGCGKSCLLKLIFGEIKTNEKSVRINGNTLIEGYRNPKDMRMLPQFNFLPKHLKVIQAFKYFDLDFSEFSDLFSEFSEWAQFKIQKLSGGNVRIIETYLILKSDTKFCVLDEPFSHLSPKNAKTFIEIIKQEKDKKGIILTDHLYNYITKISDYLYIIKDCVSYKIDDKNKLKDYGYLR